MRRLTTALAACVLCSGVMAEAQDRFGYRPNYTARRQEIPYRSPSYSEYYYRNNDQLPPYGSRYETRPSDSYRYSRGISDRYSWIPLYQFYNPTNDDQLLTAGVHGEAAYAMQFYQQDGMFYVHKTGGAGKVPLMRYFEPHTLHSFTTTQRGMEDAHLEGILGYIDVRQSSGTVPLYGWYDPQLDRYLVTTNPNSQLQQRFEYLGVLGYVMPGR